MNQKIRSMFHRIGDNQGFTLVEMALVLIIIGIIIGAIAKGKDLVRGSEQKRIYTKFFNEWRLGYLNFYDRTGKILGDTWDGAAIGQDGQADTSAGTGVAATAAGRAAMVTTAVTTYKGVQNIGLNAPVTNRPTAFEYSYVDSQGTTHIMDIAFQWDGVNNYNYMLIQNIPVELGLAMDTMVDGKAEGNVGDFLYIDGAGAAAAWPSTPTTAVTARWKMQF